MGSPLPITSKLLPFRWRNLVYLAEVAALTRMATGVARVLENRPSQQKNESMSQNEKRQALTERFFVEILGTMGYMGFLHLGQDLVDKIAARVRKVELPQLEKTEQLQTLLRKYKLEVEDINEKIKEVYNPKNLKNDGKGLVYRVLYEHEGVKKDEIAPKATLASLQEKIVALAKERDHASVIGDLNKVKSQVNHLNFNELTEFIENEQVLRKFAASNNKWAATSILTGVGLSALVGGTVTQWMNDRVIAPSAKKWLNKNFIAGAIKPGLNQQKSNSKIQNPAQSAGPVAGANPFNFPPAMVAQPQQHPIAPVYLPNPKMQPPATAFGAKSLPRPYTTPLSSYNSTRLGGGV